jgi:hypothetical protein
VGKVPAGQRPRRPRLILEQLEDRCVPAIIEVTGLADGLAPVKNLGNGVYQASTLRSAVQEANTLGGTNTIELTVAGTYKITLRDNGTEKEDNSTGDFDILPTSGTLTIVNTSGGSAAVSGNKIDRVFDINPNNDTVPSSFAVVMKGFTITNGVASDSAAPDGPAASGGGIRAQGSVNLTLQNMVVTGNTSTADGGGIVMLNANPANYKLTIKDSTISNNHSGDAGGGVDTDGPGKVVISGTTVSGNTDSNQGAGIYIDAIQVNGVFEGADMNLTNSIVSNNQALSQTVTGSGGGISNAGNGTMTIRGSTIENNVSGGSGGGFSDENNVGTLVVSDSLFLNNSAAADGGGIQEGGPSTTITNTEFKGNTAGGRGGGLFANGTTLILQRSTFYNNTAAVSGGGLEVDTTGSDSIISDTTVTGNNALANAANGATSNGGGLDAVTLGRLKLLHDTINGNFADNGGGVFWDGSGTFVVQNTIIADNSADITGPDADNTAGKFTDNGGNLIGVSGTGSGNTGFTNSSTQTGTTTSPLDPLLGALGNNGGPTIGAPGTTIVLETEKPEQGSPAIGNGVAGAPDIDERGFPTVVNGVINVGAVSQASGS